MVSFFAVNSSPPEPALSPYTDEELAKTNRLTRASREATSMFSVPVALTSFVVRGSSMDLGTEPRAAS